MVCTRAGNNIFPCCGSGFIAPLFSVCLDSLNISVALRAAVIDAAIRVSAQSASVSWREFNIGICSIWFLDGRVQHILWIFIHYLYILSVSVILKISLGGIREKRNWFYCLEKRRDCRKRMQLYVEWRGVSRSSVCKGFGKRIC